MNNQQAFLCAVSRFPELYYMARFVNIHSHLPAGDQEFCLQNIFSPALLPHTDQPCSLGLHPWMIEVAGWQKQLEEMLPAFSSTQVLAVGECGLDTLSTCPWPIQVSVFTAQALEANRLQKPLVIHCVRAYPELLSLIQKNKIRVPCIFHGFNKSAALARQILSAGHYLSFGKHILHRDEYLPLTETPPDRFLLETDQADIPIEHVYRQAAKLKGMEIETLILQQLKNLFTIFGIQLNPDTHA